jgi:predicted transcriptional regulator
MRTEWYARTVWEVNLWLIASRAVGSIRQIKLLAELAAARNAVRLSQRQLAQRLKRSDSFVSKFEAGERRLTVLEFLEVCDALGADAQGIIKRVVRD